MVGEGMMLAAQMMDSCMMPGPGPKEAGQQNKPLPGGRSALRGETVMIKSAELILLVDERLKLLGRPWCSTSS